VNAGNEHTFVLNAELVSIFKNTADTHSEIDGEMYKKCFSKQLLQTFLLIQSLLSRMCRTTVRKRNNFQQSNGGKTKLEWLSVHNIPAGKDLLIVYSRLSRLMEGEGTHG
jgi:hypothetical protein